MKDEKKRTLYLKVRVSPEEMAAIKKKFENSSMSCLSTFVRAMIFEGYIVHIDENELRKAEWVSRKDITGQPNPGSMTHEMMIWFRDHEV